MFFSNNLLFALTSIDASIKNLKSAFGRILVPISLPSSIQPGNFVLLLFTNSFCFEFKITLNLGYVAIREASLAVFSDLKSSFFNSVKFKSLAISKLYFAKFFSVFFFLDN